MQLAFSTLACPGWSVEQVIEAGTGMGYDGVEWRLLDGELIDPLTDSARLERAVAQCRAAGLAVPALDTSCRFNLPDAGARSEQVAVLRAWIDLAGALDVPVLRVFGGHTAPEATTAPAVANGWVAEALRTAAGDATRAGVTIALETHDDFSSARRVAAVLDRVGSPAAAALWDSHHPFRVGESPEEVIAALGMARIAFVHVKDARRLTADAAQWQLVPLGEGEVPVQALLRALATHGYDGWISVEWEKKWHPELAEPEIALPRHSAWLRDALAAATH
jgi:fatty-acyl-CoA synthase